MRAVICHDVKSMEACGKNAVGMPSRKMVKGDSKHLPEASGGVK